MSSHKAEVFTVQDVRPHPGADRLDLVSYMGYQTVTRKGEYRPGDKAVFIEPDTIVSVKRPEFSFLAERANQDGEVRIKAIRLRGEKSFGLLVPAPRGSEDGADLFAEWGLEHFDPPVAGETKDRWAVGGENCPAPRGFDLPKYDLENLRRWKDVIEPGEPCIVQEKADGAFMRAVYSDGAYHVGSRNGWKREYADHSHLTVEFLTGQGCPEDKAKEVVERVLSRPKAINQWWRGLHETPALEKYLRDNPGNMVYAELHGTTNILKYQYPEGNRVAAFDLWVNGSFMDMERSLFTLADSGVPVSPVLNDGDCFTGWLPMPFDFERVCEMAEGETLMRDAKKGLVREGVVVSPAKERRHPKVGRVKLKCVGVGFSELKTR